MHLIDMPRVLLLRDFAHTVTFSVVPFYLFIFYCSKYHRMRSMHLIHMPRATQLHVHTAIFFVAPS
jgi:hypothetical protein